MATKYDGKTGDEWREVADDAQYQINHTVNEDTKDYWRGVYRTATLKASIADGLDDDSGTTSSGGDTIPNYNYNISNYTDDTIVRGTTNADIICSNASNVTVYGGDGNDTVRIAALTNSANTNVKIFGESGNDRIENYGADNSLIDGDAGNDVIDNWGKNVTISGGAGNDSINLARGGATNCVIKYISGGGNDTVVGFVTSSTLSIAGGNYSTTKSDSDIIVKVGNGNVILVGVAELDSVNIKSSSSSSSNPYIFGTEDADRITTARREVIIQAFGGNDTISVYGGCVYDWVEGGAGNDDILIRDVLYSTILGGTGDDYISSNRGSSLIISGEDGNDYIYAGGEYANNNTLNGGAGNDTIYNYTGSAKIDGGTGNDRIVNSAGWATINGGAGNDYIETYLYVSDNREYITIDGGEGNDTINNEPNYASQQHAYMRIQYASGDGNDLIQGFNENSTLDIAGSSYSTKKSGSNVIVTVGTGKITLQGAASLEAVNINFAKTEWKLDGTTATYGTTVTYGTPSRTLVTVNGVKSLNGISLSGRTVTVSDAALNESTITVSDGYTLTLDNDVTKSSTTKAWSLNKTTASYKQTTSAGYTLADNAITYSQNSVETLATVKGVKSLDGLKISGTTITVSDASLNAKNVTVSDGYTLKLGSNVAKPANQKAAWSFSGTTATYKGTYKTAGYVLAADSKSISYSRATSAATLATVKGAKSAQGLTVNGKKITLKKSALSDKVTIGGGYEFDFASDYKKATITGSNNGDTITARGTNLSINGGAGSDTIKLLGSTTTVTGGAGSDVFIYGGGKNVITDYATGDKISIGGAISKASVSGNNVVFTIGTGSLTVKNGKGKSLALTDSKGKSYSAVVNASNAMKATLTNTASPVTLDAAIKTVDASARTKAIKITGNASANSIVGGTKNDSLVGLAGNDTIRGGSGNDTLTGGTGNDLFVYTAGKDVITDYATGDKISVGGAISKASVSGSNIIFTIGTGSLTVKNGKGKTLAITDSKGKSYSAVVSASNAMKAVLTNTASPVTLDAAIKTVDASARTKAIKITGNASANSIVGGTKNDSLVGLAGNDTIRGGSGNDTLTGGTGNDLFVYTAGKDVITDYATGDKISVGGAISKASVSGSNIIFTIGTGSLTVKNGKGKTLAITDSKGKSYSAVVSASNAMKAVLTNTASPVTLDAAIKTVDASSRTKAIKITGNASANSIVGGTKNDSLYGGAGNDSIRGGSGNDKLFGGDGNDTLTGGAGNDLLWGNACNDTFIYGSGDGKDVIFGFESNDLLKITSAFSAPTYNSSAKPIAFKVGTGSVTLKQFGSTTTFHVNSDTYRLSGNRLTKQ